MVNRTQKLPVADDHLGVTTWSVFLRTHAAVVRAIEREVEGATGLPLSWYDVLLELDAAEHGRLRMQELAARVVLSRTRVSRLVDDLERAEMVDRQPDPADGRATLAAITDLGRRELRRTAPIYLERIQEHFSAHLTPRQLRTIHDGLEQVLSAHESSEPRAADP